MRLDRLITLGVVSPLRKLLRADRRGERLPVLMYHSISRDPEPGVGPYYRVCCSPERFAEHMQCIADLGYRGVGLSEALSAPAAERLVAITFDDGFRDFLTEAVPILRKHGFTATMYLPTAFIGDDRRRFLSRECLTWSEVRDLQAFGFEFGSHTVSHPKLVGLSWDAIAAELAESKRRIEVETGRGVGSFAYPFAFPQANTGFVKKLFDTLRSLGFQSCATTVVGIHVAGSGVIAIPRLPANEADDLGLLQAKLAGAYNWVGSAQSFLKRIKSA